MSIMSTSYSPPVYGTCSGCACWRRWRNSRRRRRKVRWVLFLFLFVFFLLELPSARQWYVGWLICCGGAGRAGRARRGGSRRRWCCRSVHQRGVTRFKVVKPVAMPPPTTIHMQRHHITTDGAGETIQRQDSSTSSSGSQQKATAAEINGKKRQMLVTHRQEVQHNLRWNINSVHKASSLDLISFFE